MACTGRSAPIVSVSVVRKCELTLLELVCLVCHDGCSSGVLVVCFVFRVQIYGCSVRMVRLIDRLTRENQWSSPSLCRSYAVSHREIRRESSQVGDYQ